MRVREVRREYVLHLGKAHHRVEFSPQLGRSWDTLHVPAEVFSELDRGTAGIRLVLLRHMRVLECDREPPLDLRRFRFGLPFQESPGLVEDPGLTERPARDHDCRAPCLSLHPNGILGGLDVAVADNRNVQSGGNRADFLPARAAAVHLRSRARVQCERPRARVLTAEGDIYGKAGFLAPPASDLHRNWQVRARRYRPDHRLDERKIFETARATITPHDFLHGTAEIDVDELWLEHIGHEPSRLAHCEGIRPEDLDADRTLIGAEAELVERRRVLSPDPLCREKFGDHDVRTKAAAESPEWRLRHTGHRREIERDVVPDLEWKSHLSTS